MRLVVKATMLLADAIIALAMALPVAACLGVVAVRRRLAPRRAAGRLMHLSAGSSTNTILVKFGSFSLLFETEAPPTSDFAGNLLFWFPSRNSLRLDFPNGWTVLEQGKALGVLHMTGTMMYLLRAGLALERFDIRAIRAWDPFICGAAGWLLSRVGAVPWCISVHADYAKRYKLDGAAGAPTLFGWRRGAEAVEAFAFRRADLVMPIRDSLIPYCVGLGARPGRIRVIPHGIDLSPLLAPATLDVRERLDLPADVPILSFAGRLSRENYVYDVLDLARRLAAEGREAVVVVAGGGVEHDALQEAAKDPALGGCLRLVGYQPREVVYALRQASAVSLCLMGGYSLIEAAAAGRPVIAYDIEWHSEIVRSGETGALIAEGDTDALYRETVRLLDDPALAAHCGERARARAVDRHDIARTAAIKRGWYAELLAGPADLVLKEAD